MSQAAVKICPNINPTINSILKCDQKSSFWGCQGNAAHEKRIGGDGVEEREPHVEKNFQQCI